MYMHCTRNYNLYYYFYYTMIINYNVCILVCKESKINYLNFKNIIIFTFFKQFKYNLESEHIAKPLLLTV